MKLFTSAVRHFPWQAPSSALAREHHKYRVTKEDERRYEEAQRKRELRAARRAKGFVQ